jgi:thiol-disulfide isomerase/thioredoxin
MTRPLLSLRTWAALAAAALAVALVLAVLTRVYPIGGADGNGQTPDAESKVKAAPVPADGRITRAFAVGDLAAFVVRDPRKEVADVTFTDASGKAHSLKEWRGRVVLVNLWATWCAPCRKEMPALAALQQKLGSPDFEVVAISVDRKGAEVAAPFLAEIGVTALALYVDPSTLVLEKLRAAGLPATFLIDRQGREIGRLFGPADWNGADAERLVRAAIAEGP